MKKTLAVLAAVAVAGVASADIIEVTLQNVANSVHNGGVPVNTALYQLVYNTDAPVAVDASLVNAGDNLLSTFTTTPGFAGTWSDLGEQGGQYDVGLAGFLTLRVFDAAAVGVGDFYIEYGVDVDGGLTAFNPLDLATIYDAGALVGVPFGSDTAGDNGDILGSPNSLQIVPEPATIGLMGIAGLGMFLARRKVRS